VQTAIASWPWSSPSECSESVVKTLSQLKRIKRIYLKNLRLSELIMEKPGCRIPLEVLWLEHDSLDQNSLSPPVADKEFHRSESSETSNSGFETCRTECEAVGGWNALGAQDHARLHDSAAHRVVARQSRMAMADVRRRSQGKPDRDRSGGTKKSPAEEEARTPTRGGSK
jgi:hypothetical protein